MGCSIKTLIALGIVSLSAACSSTPPPEDPVLIADPPAGGATGLSASAANTELQRAIAYIKNEKFDEAKKHLELALSEKSDHAEANYYMGVTNEMLGDKKAAETFYAKAIELDATLIDAATNLAALYLDEPSRPDQAIAVVKKALEKAPDDPGLNQNLGFAYGLKKDYANAAKAYDAAVAKGDSADLRFAYGALLFEANDMAKAAEQLKKALDGAKENVPMVVTIGRMLGKAGAYADCVRAFDIALKSKTEPEWLVRRGTCKHELSDEPGARQDFEAATKADPKFAAAFYYLGMSYSLDLKKYKLNAVNALEQAAKLGEGTEIGKNAKDKLKEIKKQKP
ncbi:MAG: tetratricopeptide repeat protein [Polyangiaceae bacterium]|nr:tetratricopeptide repeat protein [Polyangiaceae bacterium]